MKILLTLLLAGGVGLVLNGCGNGVVDDGRIRCSVTSGIRNLEQGMVIFTSTDDPDMQVKAPLGYGGCIVQLAPGEYEAEVVSEGIDKNKTTVEVERDTRSLSLDVK